MKTTVGLLLLAGLVTVAHAQFSFDIPALLEKHACSIVYHTPRADRPNVEKACQNPLFPSLSGLLECTPINFAEFNPFMRWMLSMFLGHIKDLSLCLPLECNSNATCKTFDQNSICTTPERLKPSQEQIQSIKDQCMLGQDNGKRGCGGGGGGGGFDPLRFMPPSFARSTRCSHPPAVFSAKKACRMTINGSTVTKPCCQSKTCSENVDCSLLIGTDNVDLTFCRTATQSGQP